MNSDPNTHNSALIIAQAKSRSKAAPSALTYRGVTLPRLPIPSQFTTAEIKKAVENAIAKNADALARHG